MSAIVFHTTPPEWKNPGYGGPGGLSLVDSRGFWLRGWRMQEPALCGQTMQGELLADQQIGKAGMMGISDTTSFTSKQPRLQCYDMLSGSKIEYVAV